MLKNTTLVSAGRMQRLLGATVGMTLILLAATACGTASQSSSPANAPASAQGPEAASAASPGAQGIVSRANPSSGQVAVVIAQVKKRIPMSFQPSEAHVRSFGDAACTAFDQGKTAPQVRDLVLQAASQLPSIKVSAADADFAVRTAVDLFCPGYSGRLAS